MIHADPSNRFVVQTDLGQDRIYVSALDAGLGTLSPVAGSPFSVGSRFATATTFHRNGQLAVLAATKKHPRWMFFHFVSGNRIPEYPADHFHAAPWIQGNQFHCGDSALARWAISLCVQSTPRHSRYPLAESRRTVELYRRSIHHGRLPKAHTNRSWGSISGRLQPTQRRRHVVSR